MRRPRFRRAFKWAGVAVCVVIAGAWAASYTGGFTWRMTLTTGVQHRWLFVRFRNGTIFAAAFSEPQIPRDMSVADWMRDSPGPHWNFVGDGSRTVWMPHVYVEEYPATYGRYKKTLTYLPAWISFLLCAVPTAILSCRDYILMRRARAGCCPKCRYDRSGLAPDAVCPECGQAPHDP